MLRSSTTLLMNHIDPVYTIADDEMQHLHRHHRNQAALFPAQTFFEVLSNQAAMPLTRPSKSCCRYNRTCSSVSQGGPMEPTRKPAHGLTSRTRIGGCFWSYVLECG